MGKFLRTIINRKFDFKTAYKRTDLGVYPF